MLTDLVTVAGMPLFGADKIPHIASLQSFHLKGHTLGTSIWHDNGRQAETKQRPPSWVGTPGVGEYPFQATPGPVAWDGKGGIGQEERPPDTHSTYLVQGGGSCWAMNTQLVRMVHMMSMLKSLRLELRKLWEGLTTDPRKDPQRMPWEVLTHKSRRKLWEEPQETVRKRYP